MNKLNINIDFQIFNTGDPNVLSVVDYSNWANIENKVAIIEVTLPGEQEPYTHYFDKNKVNIFNSSNLGITCVNGCSEDELTPLPDGVYYITIKGSPSKFNKTRAYLRTENTRLDLDTVYINNVNKDTLSYENVNRIELLLSGAEANVRYNNIGKAQDLLFMAQDLIEKLKCNNCK